MKHLQRHLLVLLLALLPGVLFIVTVGTAIAQGELEGSISAYYWGPVRDVFVGVMIAVAALLVTGCFLVLRRQTGTLRAARA